MYIKAKDLANQLGVSPATISLVLHNKPGISSALRRSLVDRIKELGYGDMLQETPALPVPLPAQEPPRSFPRRSIAYLIYTASDEASDRFAFYPAVLEGAEMQARENNCNLVVFHMNRGGVQRLDTLLNQSGTVMGAIIQATHISPEILEDISSLQIPCVFIDAYLPSARVSCVCTNNEQGMESVVQYLRDMGHRKIGYVSSGQDTDCQLERRRCFHLALRELGLSGHTEFEFTAKSAGDFISQWQSREELPSALAVENDLLAWHVAKALQSRGVRIPEDVSITGFDDRSLCTMMEPNLTSVKNSRHLMGREAVLLLGNLLQLRQQGLQDLPLKVELPTSLMARDSVRRLAD